VCELADEVGGCLWRAKRGEGRLGCCRIVGSGLVVCKRYE
jgi:hypothetical protein